jgi:hypothetical protein
MMRTFGAAVLSVLMAAVLALVTVAPASATTTATAPASFLEFSTNGTSWSAAAPSSLFPGGVNLTPGDSKTATIYVRSTRTDPTTLSASMSQVVTSDPGFGAVMTIGAASALGRSWSKPASALPSCQPIFTKMLVATDQVVPLSLTLAMSPSAVGVQGQKSWIRFTLLLGLADAGAPLLSNDCPSSATAVPAFNDNGPTVAFTGTNTLYPGLTLAGFAGGFGVLILVAVRRRRRVAT